MDMFRGEDTVGAGCAVKVMSQCSSTGSLVVSHRSLLLSGPGDKLRTDTLKLYVPIGYIKQSVFVG